MEEQIARAKARIKELQTLVKHWEKIKPLNASNRQGVL
jgi:DNA polymerase sigma